MALPSNIVVADSMPPRPHETELAGRVSPKSVTNLRKVCLISSVHPPFDVRIYEKEAKSLVADGYDVTIIAPHKGDERSHNVKVRSVPPSNSRRERMTRTIWRVFETARQVDAFIYHFHDPELIPVGLLLKLIGKRVVYDVHEDVPLSILDKDWIHVCLRTPLAKAVGIGEGLSVKMFDGIIAATPAIARRFPQRKTCVVQNYPHLDRIRDPEAPPYLEREAICVYLGLITALRGTREMIGALSLLPESLGVRLALAGAFDPPEYEQILMDSSGWERVDFQGWLGRSEVTKLLGKARVGLVLHPPNGHSLESKPIKLFEYMAAGLPVVVTDVPFWREIVSSADCGLLVDPLDQHAVADAIRWLFQHPRDAEAMGQRGAEAVRTKYSWGMEEEKLLGLYAQLTNEHRR